MVKPLKRFVCQSCGAVTTKWSGRCESCGEWNTIVEEAAPAPGPAGGGLARTGPSGRSRGRLLEFAGLRGTTPQPERYRSGIAEFDRVCGGGLVVGSALLIGGDPGIGKSTLLLQVAAALARQNTACAYISGEEALDQVRLRGERLGLGDAPVQLTTATSVRDIVATLERPDAPRVAVIDSIQTMWLDTIDSTPGHGEPGARLGAGAGRAGQAARHRRAAGRPRHQGRRHRRPARARAHGRHRPLLRGRARPSLPHPAHRQEPLRPDRRDRRVRDVRPRPGRRRQPLGAVPGRTARQCLGGLRVRRHRGHAAPAGRDPGAGRALLLRHAAPCRGRLGFQPAGHGAGGARGALRRAGRRQRRLPQCRRRPAHRRAGGRPRGRRRRGVVAVRRARSGRHGGVRRDRAGRRGPSGQPARGPPARGGQARLPQCAGAARSRGHRAAASCRSRGHRH